MLNFNSWQRLLTVMMVVGIFITAMAVQNPYDKFRNRELSNRGYISEEEELKLAGQLHQELLKQHRIVSNQAVSSYINRLGDKLAKRSARPNIPYNFYVVDDKSINAFATLGGRVYVHTGLLAATQSEAQLASVVGHEIGHIAARHGLENVKRAQKYGIAAAGAQVLGAILGGQTGAGIGQMAGNLIAGGFLMKHSRDAEREADYLGLYTIRGAGYRPTGMIEMFEMLSEVSRSQPNAIGSILASHPPPSERAQNTRIEIQQHLAGSAQSGMSTSPEFQRIKSMLTGSSSGSRRVRPRN